jgi:peptide deformylase
MARLSIRIYPDPVLRIRCVAVEKFDEELASLVADMKETMIAAPGIGLAAPQIGVESRIALVDLSVGKEESEYYVLINPEISSRSGEAVEVEGCLSIPDFSEKVTRPTQLSVSYQDLQGERHTLQTEGWLARAICHELDHLDGVLFVDHLKGLRRERAKRALRRLIREQES